MFPLNKVIHSNRFKEPMVPTMIKCSVHREEDRALDNITLVDEHKEILSILSKSWHNWGEIDKLTLIMEIFNASLAMVVNRMIDPGSKNIRFGKLR